MSIIAGFGRHGPWPARLMEDNMRTMQKLMDNMVTGRMFEPEVIIRGRGKETEVRFRYYFPPEVFGLLSHGKV